MSEALNVEKIFGEKVFTFEKMRERLTRKVFLEVKRVIDYGGELSMTTAEVVAKAMKDWAVENGATHYTHWFQPLTGITAEKHDSFVSHPDTEVFEIDSIKDNRELFPVVTIIIMEAFINKMRRLKGVRKQLIVEEAWKALSDRKSVV